MTSAAGHILVARERRYGLGAAPLVMGILNATPDSFSDAGDHPDLEARAQRGMALLAEGADLLDVGGESGVTNRPAVEPAEEIERVVPLVERLAGAGAAVSVDTYKPQVARAALEAGAVMVNDPSGLIDPDVAAVCADAGAALVVTHTRARPKEKLHRPHYDDVVDDVKRFLGERLEVARAAGVPDERLVVCPGPDLGKDPAQTIELLRRLDEIHALGLPVLLAVSRKDFVGALTGPAAARAPGRHAGRDRARARPRRALAARARRRRDARLPRRAGGAARRGAGARRPAARGRPAAGGSEGRRSLRRRRR